MPIPKKSREIVLNKYGGRCAYCGCELKGKFQVDHLISQRNFEWHLRNQYKIPAFLEHLTLADVNHIDNLMPACCSCNNYKSTCDLETFRKEIQMQPERLMRAKPMVRLAERFGLVKIQEKPVVFYFETVSDLTQ